MRRAPPPLLLAWLLLLLLCRAPLGAGRASDLDGPAGSALSLRLLLSGGERAGPWPLPPALPAAGPDGAALAGRSLVRSWPAGELRRRLSELGERLKRHEPPLSIDLTFHLLRQMLEISRAQSRLEQAGENRLLFDDLGK